MEKAIHKKGFIQALFQIIEKISRAEINNLVDLIKGIFRSEYGVLMRKVQGGGYSDDLKPVLEDDPQRPGEKRVKVLPGKALTKNKHIASLDEEWGFSLVRPTEPAVLYLKIKYIQYCKSEDIVPFDENYSTDGYSYLSGRSEIILDGDEPNPNNDEVLLGIVRYQNNEWSLEDKREMVLLRSVEHTAPIEVGFVSNIVCRDEFAFGPPSVIVTWDCDYPYDSFCVVVEREGEVIWRTEVSQRICAIPVPPLIIGEVVTIKIRVNYLGFLGPERSVRWYVGDNVSPTYDSARPFELTTWVDPPSGVTNPLAWVKIRVPFKTGASSGWYDPKISFDTSEKTGSGLWLLRVYYGVSTDGVSHLRYWEKMIPEGGIIPEYIEHTFGPFIPRQVLKFKIFVEDFARNVASTSWETIVAGQQEAPVPPSNVVIQDILNGVRVGWFYEHPETVLGFEVYVSQETASIDARCLYKFIRASDETDYSVEIPVGWSPTDNPPTFYVSVLAVGLDGQRSTPVVVSKVPQYVANSVKINEIINEIQNARQTADGITFASLKDRLDKGLSDFGIEIIEARLGYRSLAEAIQRSGQQPQWKYVRIVSKSGPYTSIQAAVDSITEDGAWTIIIMPGKYVEDVLVDIPNQWKNISFIGIGNVVLDGSLKMKFRDNKVMIHNIAIRRSSPTTVDSLVYIIGGSQEAVCVLDKVSILGEHCTQNILKTEATNLVMRNVAIKSTEGLSLEYPVYISQAELSQKARIYSCFMRLRTSSMGYGINLDMDESVVKNCVILTTNNRPCIVNGNGWLYIFNCVWNFPPDPGSGRIVYGTAENVSNIRVTEYFDFILDSSFYAPET